MSSHVVRVVRKTAGVIASRISNHASEHHPIQTRQISNKTSPPWLPIRLSGSGFCIFLQVPRNRTAFHNVKFPVSMRKGLGRPMSLALKACTLSAPWRGEWNHKRESPATALSPKPPSVSMT